MMRIWLGLIVCFFLSPGISLAWPPNQHYNLNKYKRFSDSTECRIQLFFEKHYKSGIFNGTFLFFKNDSLFQGAMGMANFQKNDTLDNDDLFQLASVSKTVTGIAILQLHQDGLLNIDDSVHWYIPTLERHNLTIRNLLCHMSGLPDYFYFPTSVYWPFLNIHMKNSDVVMQLNLQTANSFGEPGRYHEYCNTNFALLALIVENISGMDFRKYAELNIFKPSGMRYTHICNYDSIPLENYTVEGYENKHYYGDIPHNGTTGDKGVYANTVEMFLLDRMLRTQYLLHKGTEDLMWSPQVATNADGGYYGMGWRMKWIDGKKWVFHNGWWKGFRTYYWRCLDEDKCYVVLTNNVYGPFLRTMEMVDLLR
jgi:CubicO group peptidase (beta-lactamase class C family)